MTHSAELNWALLEAGCIERKRQCEEAIEKLQSRGSGSLTEGSIISLATVVAELDTRILECKANIGAQ